MFETSELIYAILNGYAPLMAVASKISPLLASQKTDFPFVNFTLSEEPSFSKSGRYAYGLTINCFAEDYDTTLQIADLVKDALAAHQIKFNYLGSQPEAQDGIIITSSNYSFKN